MMNEIKIDESIFNLRKSATSNISRVIGKQSFEELMKKSILRKHDLICKASTCSNRVHFNFHRKKMTVYSYCSHSCFMNRPDRLRRIEDNKTSICRYCHSKFKTKEVRQKSHRENALCHKIECRDRMNDDRSQKIKEKHWTKTHPHAKEIRSRMDKSRSVAYQKKREAGNPVIPWNKGKTGIYSKETIEKIRNATIKQLENQVFKKTSIEKTVENFLIESDIKYKYSFILNRRQFDFILLNSKCVVECDGDYWHANPAIYERLGREPSEKQKMKRLDDKIKNKIAEDNGYKILRFWEHDINNNFEYVKNAILNVEK